MTPGAPVRLSRHVAFERLHNFRDLGGYPTTDGRSVAWGRLYRSDSLCRLAGEDWRRFGELDIRTVIDLRHPDELRESGRAPVGEFGYHHLSVEYRRWNKAGYDPGQGLPRFLADRYHEVSEDGVVELASALALIADPANAPVVFHCAAGKDRTGILAALTLTLLGVAEQDVIDDYALTGLATERLIDDWRAEHPGQDRSWPGHGQAPAASMRLFLTELAAEHGSVAGYCRARLGVDDRLVEALRGHLLEPIER